MPPCSLLCDVWWSSQHQILRPSFLSCRPFALIFSQPPPQQILLFAHNSFFHIIDFLLSLSFFFGCPVWLVWAQFPDQRLNQGHGSEKCRVLTTGLPGNSLSFLFEGRPLVVLRVWEWFKKKSQFYFEKYLYFILSGKWQFSLMLNIRLTPVSFEWDEDIFLSLLWLLRRILSVSLIGIRLKIL